MSLLCSLISFSLSLSLSFPACIIPGQGCLIVIDKESDQGGAEGEGRGLINNSICASQCTSSKTRLASLIMRRVLRAVPAHFAY